MKSCKIIFTLFVLPILWISTTQAEWVAQYEFEEAAGPASTASNSISGSSVAALSDNWGNLNGQGQLVLSSNTDRSDITLGTALTGSMFYRIDFKSWDTSVAGSINDISTKFGLRLRSGATDSTPTNQRLDLILKTGTGSFSGHINTFASGSYNYVRGGLANPNSSGLSVILGVNTTTDTFSIWWDKGLTGIYSAILSDVALSINGEVDFTQANALTFDPGGGEFLIERIILGTDFSEISGAPAITPIENKQVAVGGNLSFSVSASQDDLDPITLSAANLPNGASFPAATSTSTVSSQFNWESVAVEPGDYTVTFNAADSNGSDSVDVVISVLPPIEYVHAETMLPFGTTDDAYVRVDTPDTNYGDTPILEMRESGNKQRRSFVQFEVDSHEAIESAILKIYSEDSGYSIECKPTSSGWSENTITWNNIPTTGDTIASSGTISASGWVSLDVSSVVTTNGLYSFELFSTGNGATTKIATSGEGIRAPLLEITYGVNSDSDGLPDNWEIEQFGDLVTSAGRAENKDKDSMTDIQEYFAGTQANNSSDTMNLSLSSYAPGTLEVSFDGLVGRSYSLEVSESLDTWNHSATVGPLQSSDLQASLQGTVTGNPNACFGRVKIHLDQCPSARFVPLGYTFTWGDHFGGNALDPEKWFVGMKDPTTGDLIPGADGDFLLNDRYEGYVTQEDSYVDSGKLILRAQKRNYTGTSPAGEYAYTSGWVTSMHRGFFNKGYVEVRAKFPTGDKLWPAIWLVSEDLVWGPEWDLWEYYGHRWGQTERYDYMGMHLMTGYEQSGNLWPTPDPQRFDEGWIQPFDAQYDADAWHVYGWEWTDTYAKWWIDGELVRTLYKSETQSPSEWPDETMYIILNNGVRSVSPDETTAWPNNLEIDYIEVYQKP